MHDSVDHSPYFERVGIRNFLKSVPDSLVAGLNLQLPIYFVGSVHSLQSIQISYFSSLYSASVHKHGRSRRLRAFIKTNCTTGVVKIECQNWGSKMTPFGSPGRIGARGQGMMRAPDVVQNPIGKVFSRMGLAGEVKEEHEEVGILENQVGILGFLSRNVPKTWQT